ncbi:MAG: superoxide dismutase family protein [Steroidobacteraceae bacterium]
MAAATRKTVPSVSLRARGVFLLAGTVALLATGCVSLGGGAKGRTVALESRSGSSVTGTLQLSDSSAGLRIRGEVRGLAPGSEHGFHIHDKGDCSAPDASSAGPHFNPAGAPHGRAGAGAHHAGDMPNIKADAKGVAKIDQLVAGVTLAAGANGAAGRALVVHRDPDDYSSQPAGNAGPRFACGVIPAN